MRQEMPVRNYLQSLPFHYVHSEATHISRAFLLKRKKIFTLRYIIYRISKQAVIQNKNKNTKASKNYLTAKYIMADTYTSLIHQYSVYRPSAASLHRVKGVGSDEQHLVCNFVLGIDLVLDGE